MLFFRAARFAASASLPPAEPWKSLLNACVGSVILGSGWLFFQERVPWAVLGTPPSLNERSLSTPSWREGLAGVHSPRAWAATWSTDVPTFPPFAFHCSQVKR